MKKLVLLCFMGIFAPAQASLRQAGLRIARLVQTQRTFATQPVTRTSLDALQKEYTQRTQTMVQQSQQARIKLDTLHTQDQRRSARTTHAMITALGAAYVATCAQIFGSLF